MTRNVHRDNQLSHAQRAREKSVLYPVLADVGTTVMLLCFGLVTGSLTLLSEGIRSVLMLAASIYAYLVLRAIHRDRLRWFEFGVGKIEQFVAVVVGLGLAVSGLWVAQSVVDLIFTFGESATPLGLAAAAIANAVNALINTAGWFAMKIASRGDDTQVFRVQLKARFTMMVSSLFLQLTLTAAALAKDGAIGVLLDGVGASFVAGVMLVNGLRMISRALPILLDSHLPADVCALINRTVKAVLQETEIVGVRTRRGHPAAIAEVAVLGGVFSSTAALHQAGAQIAKALDDEGLRVDVAVVLASGAGNEGKDL